jgi:hypothetical protein
LDRGTLCDIVLWPLLLLATVNLDHCRELEPP